VLTNTKKSTKPANIKHNYFTAGTGRNGSEINDDNDDGEEEDEEEEEEELHQCNSVRTVIIGQYLAKLNNSLVSCFLWTTVHNGRSLLNRSTIRIKKRSIGH